VPNQNKFFVPLFAISYGDCSALKEWMYAWEKLMRNEIILIDAEFLGGAIGE